MYIQSNDFRIWENVGPEKLFRSLPYRSRFGGHLCYFWACTGRLLVVGCRVRTTCLPPFGSGLAANRWKAHSCKSAPVENEHVSNPKVENGEGIWVKLRSVQCYWAYHLEPPRLPPRIFYPTVPICSCVYFQELWHNFWHLDAQSKSQGGEKNLHNSKILNNLNLTLCLCFASDFFFVCVLSKLVLPAPTAVSLSSWP